MSVIHTIKAGGGGGGIVSSGPQAVQPSEAFSALRVATINPGSNGSFPTITAPSGYEIELYVFDYKPSNEEYGQMTSLYFNNAPQEPRFEFRRKGSQRINFAELLGGPIVVNSIHVNISSISGAPEAIEHNGLYFGKYVPI